MNKQSYKKTTNNDRIMNRNEKKCLMRECWMSACRVMSSSFIYPVKGRQTRLDGWTACLLAGWLFVCLDVWQAVWLPSFFFCWLATNTSTTTTATSTYLLILYWLRYIYLLDDERYKQTHQPYNQPTQRPTVR